MSQKLQVLLFLQSGRELTPLQALEMFATNRLAARVLELKAEGWPIATRMVRNGRKTHAAYRLCRPVQQELFGELRA